MWILHFLPDSLILSVVYAGLAIGAAATIASFILAYLPFTKAIRLATQLIGLLFLIPSLYFFSGYGVEMEWQARVKEAEEKIRIAEEKAPIVTKQIVTKYKDKIVVVNRGIEIVKKEIEVKKEIINEGCKLNPTAVEIYNKGLRGATVEVGPLQKEESK
jgi:hypothetical protein